MPSPVVFFLHISWYLIICRFERKNFGFQNSRELYIRPNKSDSWTNFFICTVRCSLPHPTRRSIPIPSKMEFFYIFSWQSKGEERHKRVGAKANLMDSASKEKTLELLKVKDLYGASKMQDAGIWSSVFSAYPIPIYQRLVLGTPFDFPDLDLQWHHPLNPPCKHYNSLS